MMAYSNSFVVNVVTDKPLREFNKNGLRTCKVPFGSEYKIRMINRGSGSAYATVSIDGTEVITGGKRFVLGSNQTLDIERFVDDLSEGRKFKFISIEEGMATGEIQDPGSPDNGIIEVVFYPEKPQPRSLSFASDSIMYTSTSTPTMDCMIDSNTLRSFNSAGATVEGSHSDQGFTLTTDNFQTDTPITIRIKMEAPAVTSNMFGLYIGGATRPFKTFNDRKTAALFMADQDFGNATVSIQPV